jgi:isoleucyl-tRNA synthetase
VSFIPGWDCHGLPIELLAGRGVGLSQLHSSLGDAFSADPESTAKAVRREARRIALRAIEGQREAFQQWGVSDTHTHTHTHTHD